LHYLSFKKFIKNEALRENIECDLSDFLGIKKAGRWGLLFQD
jgi:hypothetical protein